MLGLRRLRNHRYRRMLSPISVSPPDYTASSSVRCKAHPTLAPSPRARTTASGTASSSSTRREWPIMMLTTTRCPRSSGPRRRSGIHLSSRSLQATAARRNAPRSVQVVGARWEYDDVYGCLKPLAARPLRRCSIRTAAAPSRSPTQDPLEPCEGGRI